MDAFELPTRATVDRLLHAYFAYVNPGFPVVDENLFLAQYRARDPRNPPSLLLLHAILVVGAHVLYANDTSKRTATKTVFFRRAKVLFDSRFERNRDTIVQASLLLSWHTDGPEDVAANAWFWIGVAMRTATGLGMHRDADASTVVPHNKRMWRRVWWLLCQCDVLLSLQYGRPRSIRLEECDVKSLQPDDFRDCGENTQVSYAIHSVGLAVIISRILETRFALTSSTFGTHSPPPRDRHEIVRELNSTLARWSLELPEELRSWPGQGLCLWPSCLQLQYNTVLILLHRAPPWKQQAGQDANVCAVAAGCIVSLLQTICDRDGLKCLWISAVNSIFTALIQMDVQVRTSSPVLRIPALMHYGNTVAVLRSFSEYWPNALPILHFFEHLSNLEDISESLGPNHEGGDDTTMAAEATRRQSTPTNISLTAEVAQSHLGMGETLNAPMDMSCAGLSSHFRLGQGQDAHNCIVSGQDSSKGMASQTSRGADVQAVSDIADVWGEWRNSRWQHIDIMDEFPFVF